MIVKRNFNPIKVVQYVKSELIFSVLISVIVFIIHKQKLSVISLPFSIAAILGSALAIFIAFRNNNSYSRWWEARTHWAGIINSSRVFSRLVITLTDSHYNQQNFDKNRSEQFKRELVYIAIAWVHALRLQLRDQDTGEEVNPFLSEKDLAIIKQSQNKPTMLHLITGRKIYEAMANGTLAGFDSFQIEGQLLALANYQGGCEKIKSTPLLRQYDFFTRVFLYTFFLLLPFTLVGDFNRMNIDFLMVPIAIIISFVFAIIAKVGAVNENPFENKITDIPLTAMCNSVERDLKEMLGEQGLPKKLEPENGFLF